MPAALADFYQLIPGTAGQSGIFQRDTVQAEDHVHGRAHFMADAGKKAVLCPAALLRSQQPGLQMLSFHDALGDPVDQSVHDKDKDAAAEENGGHDQVGLAEKTDGNIPEKKHDKKKDRNIENAHLFAPLLASPDVAGIADEAIDVVNHQKASEQYHAVNDPFHRSQPTSLPLPCIILFIIP